MGSDRFSCFAILFPMWSVVLLIIRKESLYSSVAFNANVFSAFQKKKKKCKAELPEQIESLFH